MDLANLAETSAVIVAVIFEILQLRQVRHQRRREAAFALTQSIQSLQMLRGPLIIDRLPDNAGKADFDTLSPSDPSDRLEPQARNGFSSAWPNRPSPRD